MKKQIKVTSLALLLGTILSLVTPSVMVLSAENEADSQTTLWDIEDETNPGHDEVNNGDIVQDNEDVIVENTENGIVVTKYEEVEENNSGRVKRAAVSRWGKTEYTNIAVTTGVAANAINAAFWGGGKASTAMFGIPGWAIGALLGAASWTKKGDSPGNAVAKLWDKNGNGWIAFYYQRGYDAAGRVVATRYSTL